MTTTRRLGAAAVAAALSCAAPAAAHAATLAPNKPCYGGLDAFVLSGTGFTPNAAIAFARNGVPLQTTTPILATPTGTTVAAGIVQPTTAAKTLDTFTATDLTNPAAPITATTQIRRTAVKVVVKPRLSRLNAVRRVKVAGFTTGTSVYRHTVRGKSVSNKRLGKVKGACHTGSYRQRLFSPGAPSGTYRVQFDTKRKYSKKTLQRVAFRVKVYRTVRSASASAASAGIGQREQWTQITP